MKAALISFILLPLLFIALAATRFGVRAVSTLAASVIGEACGLLLYAWYEKWKLASILSGLASGSIAYRGTAGPRSLVHGFLNFAAFGIAIGLVVLAAHWLYRRIRSV